MRYACVDDMKDVNRSENHFEKNEKEVSLCESERFRHMLIRDASRSDEDGKEDRKRGPRVKWMKIEIPPQVSKNFSAVLGCSQHCSQHSMEREIEDRTVVRRRWRILKSHSEGARNSRCSIPSATTLLGVSENGDSFGEESEGGLTEEMKSET